MLKGKVVKICFLHWSSKIVLDLGDWLCSSEIIHFAYLLSFVPLLGFYVL